MKRGDTIEIRQSIGSCNDRLSLGADAFDLFTTHGGISISHLLVEMLTTRRDMQHRA